MTLEITRYEDLQAGDIATVSYEGHEITGKIWEERGSLWLGAASVFTISHFFTLVRAERPDKRLRVALEGVVRTTKHGGRAGTRHLVLDGGATINLADSHVLSTEEA